MTAGFETTCHCEERGTSDVAIRFFNADSNFRRKWVLCPPNFSCKGLQKRSITRGKNELYALTGRVEAKHCTAAVKREAETTSVHLPVETPEETIIQCISYETKKRIATPVCGLVRNDRWVSDLSCHFTTVQTPRSDAGDQWSPLRMRK